MDAWLTISSDLSEVGTQLLVLSTDRAIVVGPVRAGRMIVPRYQCKRDIKFKFVQGVLVPHSPML